MTAPQQFVMSPALRYARYGSRRSVYPPSTIVVTLITLAVTLSCTSSPSRTAAERQRLEQRQTSFLAALSGKDPDATAGHFSENGVLHVANMPALHGREAIRQFYGNVFRFLTESESTPDTMQFSDGADMAYGMGRVSNAFEGPQGRTEFAGKYLLVWEKRDGEWSIAAYSLSSDHPS